MGLGWTNLGFLAGCKGHGLERVAVDHSREFDMRMGHSGDFFQELANGKGVCNELLQVGQLMSQAREPHNRRSQNLNSFPCKVEQNCKEDGDPYLTQVISLHDPSLRTGQES